MGVWEAIGVTAVVLLSLYGAACFVTWAVWRCLGCPSHTAVVVTELEESRAEVCLRYAAATAKRAGLPLWIVRGEWSEQTEAFVERLCDGVRIVRAESVQKTSCVPSEKRV